MRLSKTAQPNTLRGSQADVSEKRGSQGGNKKMVLRNPREALHNKDPPKGPNKPNTCRGLHCRRKNNKRLGSPRGFRPDSQESPPMQAYYSCSPGLISTAVVI